MNTPPSDHLAPELRERGRLKDGTPLFSSRRLWVQFLAFGGCPDPEGLRNDLDSSPTGAVLYADWSDPRGVGLVRWSEDPEAFTGPGRRWLARSGFAALAAKPELTMVGRTYSIGYESDLDEVLVRRPVGRLSDPQLPWAVWYPVRRTKGFEALPEDEKHGVLMDHAHIGMAYGKAGQGHDIRLACHGLDRNDADFLIGVLAPELANASLVVQAMRKSRQTMHHLDALGPFFVGQAVARTAGSEGTPPLPTGAPRG